MVSERKIIGNLVTGVARRARVVSLPVGGARKSLARLGTWFFVIGFVCLVAPAHAQQMPDLSRMSGTPLPAPELATGTVSVRVMREQLGNNIVGQSVTLKGAGVERTAATDAQGRATFIEIPAGTRVVATTTVDGEALQSQEFDLPAKGGVRIALIAGLKAAAARERATAEAGAKEPPRPGIVVFGGESRIIAEFQDDNLQVFYILDVVNSARTPIDPGAPLVLELPAEATGAAMMQGSSPLASVNGRLVTIRGPFPPGTTAVQLGYMLPHGASVTIEQPFPAAVEELFVAVEKIGDMKLASPHLPEQQEGEASGSKFLMARGPRLNANQPLTMTLSGLPHRGTTVITVGLIVSLLVLVAGAWASLAAAPARRTQAAQLEARREKLFSSLVELERQRKSGKIDEKRYAAKRQHLVTELERVLGELDRSPSGGDEGLAA